MAAFMVEGDVGSGRAACRYLGLARANFQLVSASEGAGRLSRTRRLLLFPYMAPTTATALSDLRETARNHAGASGGERRSYRILRSLTHGEQCSLIDDFVGLDATRQAAIIQILADLASGDTGAIELRE